MPHTADNSDPIVIEATVIDSGEETSGSSAAPVTEDAAAKKARGAKQLLAGSAIAAVGVPMLILPGPGLAAIAGGVALAGRGYQNMTGKNPISDETRNDPEFVAGQAAGERFAQRARDFAAEELAPAGHEIAEDLKDAGSAAAAGIGHAAGVAADVAGKSFRALAGDEAADKADDFARRNVAPIAEAAASFGRGVIAGIKPHAARIAHDASQAAADATQKLANKTRDMMH